MEDKNKTVETTAEQNSTVETNDQIEAIDYDKELAEQVAKFGTADHNREGYAQRKAETEESVEQTQTTLDDVEARVTAAIEKTLPKFIPKLQATLAEDNVEAILNQLAPDNEAKRKLIKLHFENSVGLNGTLRERLENALLISNKKTIFKTQKEMAVALQNRQGLSTTGQGSSTEGQEVKDNLLSKEQLNNLKARGWDDKKIQRFKDTLRK